VIERNDVLAIQHATSELIPEETNATRTYRIVTSDEKDCAANRRRHVASFSAQCRLRLQRRQPVAFAADKYV
jgi:hypothetical protein